MTFTDEFTQEGYDGYYLGDVRSDCTYDEGTDGQYGWLKGWSIAQKEYQRAVRAKETFSSVWPVIAMVLLFTVPWFVVGLPIWGWFFVSLTALLGLFEYISYQKTGKTLSATFWDLMARHPRRGTLILVSLTLGWSILILHLLKL